jgi:hypothetical protein
MSGILPPRGGCRSRWRWHSGGGGCSSLSASSMGLNEVVLDRTSRKTHSIFIAVGSRHGKQSFCRVRRERRMFEPRRARSMRCDAARWLNRFSRGVDRSDTYPAVWRYGAFHLTSKNEVHDDSWSGTSGSPTKAWNKGLA